MKYRYLLLPVVVGALIFTGCSAGTKKNSSTEKPNSSVTYEKGADFTGVVKGVDVNSGRIILYNVLLDAEETYAYSGGTEVNSKNDRVMSMSEVALGEVYDIYTGGDGQKLLKMKGKGDIIEVENTPVAVNGDSKQVTIQGVNYAYSENMVTLSNGQVIDPMEITAQDEVTFRGVKGQAYSLIVTKGHGYVRPVKYQDFVGGTLTVQGEAILPVTKEMLLTVPEGSQQITMNNGDLTGTASVEVRRNQVTEVNMARYKSQMPDTARVKFEIEPEGAELYINGSPADYSKAIPLKYGKHLVKVVLEGYSSYSGIANINEPSPTIRISLPDESAESDPGGDDDDSSSSGNSPAEQVSSVDYDTDHKITVSAPAGAAVYVNGTYKGAIPCKFTKMLGSITLTLTKENCETKSYSIEIPDDSQDISWSFPELNKK